MPSSGKLPVMLWRLKLLCIALLLFSLALPLSSDSALPPASQMKTLGLIGGISWYSTVDYYRYINEAVNDAYGDNTNPPLIVYNLNQEKIHELQAAGKWDDIADQLAQAANRLRASGAQAIVF